MSGKCRGELINSIHNLAVSHEKLSAEFWVLRAEGGYETSQLLLQVCLMITEKIKEINAELAVREAMGDE